LLAHVREENPERLAEVESIIATDEGLLAGENR